MPPPPSNKSETKENQKGTRRLRLVDERRLGERRDAGTVAAERESALAGRDEAATGDALDDIDTGQGRAVLALDLATKRELAATAGLDVGRGVDALKDVGEAGRGGDGAGTVSGRATLRQRTTLVDGSTRAA